MKFYEFDQCCCGCSLRTGTKVIGVLFMLIGIGLFVRVVLEAKSSFNIKIENDVMLTINSICQIIGLGVEIVATALLLIAAWKSRKPMFLVPWLVLKGSAMPALIGLSLYVVALLTAKIGISTGMAFMAVSLVATVIYFYCLLVVFSFYHELKNKNPKSDEKSSMLDEDYADDKHVIVV